MTDIFREVEFLGRVNKQHDKLFIEIPYNEQNKFVSVTVNVKFSDTEGWIEGG
jgi:hypothetical protein